MTPVNFLDRSLVGDALREAERSSFLARLRRGTVGSGSRQNFGNRALPREQNVKGADGQDCAGQRNQKLAARS